MPKRSDYPSKDVEMNTHADVRDLLWAAVPQRIGDNRKSWLSRAARVMGWGERRTRALFYCEARVVTADEWRTLNQRLDALKDAERRHGEQVDELREAYRVARHDRVVAVGNPDRMGGEPSADRDAGHPDGGAASRPVRSPGR